MQQPGQATVGIVLAGGNSTRLASVAATGGGKALLTFQGKTFLENIVTVVAAEVGPTIVVAAAGHAGHAGHACHAAAQPPRLAFVASCDVPLLRREVVRLLMALAAESDALWTVPVVHGHRQVLVSVMRVELLSRIEAWLATGRRDLRGLFKEMAQTDPQSVGEVTEEACKAVDPTLESFVDIDTPDDLERLQSR